MTQFIKHLSAVGLHGRYDIDIDFSESVNIVHGVNGAGKTTLLHIIANAVNFDLERFTHLRYRKIILDIANGCTIELDGEPADDGSHLSQVTLSIDREHLATWPVHTSATSHELRRDLFQELTQRIRTVRDQRSITTEATYFPAFRTMIEAWSSVDPTELRQATGIDPRRLPSHRLSRSKRSPSGPGRFRRHFYATDFAREVFGQFVPLIDYPSPREIQQQLDRAIQRAVNLMASEDRSLLSDAFIQVFDAISRDHAFASQDSRTPDVIRASISDQLDQLQLTQSDYGLQDRTPAFAELRAQLLSSQLPGQDRDDTTTRILRVYEQILLQRNNILKASFSAVRDYIDAVNEFLDGKQLVTATQEVESTPHLQLQYNDDALSPIDTLSSGERQIVGLMYSASNIDQSSVILVDEPEISLHVDWQRKILGAMVRQLPSKQLIVCTHSPVIGSEFAEDMVELIPEPTKSLPDMIHPDRIDDEIWPDEDFEDFA